jgi:hypothetical protein
MVTWFTFWARLVQYVVLGEVGIGVWKVVYSMLFGYTMRSGYVVCWNGRWEMYEDEMSVSIQIQCSGSCSCPQDLLDRRFGLLRRRLRSCLDALA